jgi:hypothetical protein
MLFLGSVAAFGASAIWSVSELTILSSIFPITVAVITLIFSAVALAVLLRGKVNSSIVFDSEVGWRQGGEYKFPLLHYVVWIVGFVVGIYLLGLVLAVVLFFPLFLTVKARASWLTVVIMTAGVVGALMLLSSVLVIDLPRGLLQESVQLPWPLG